MSGQNVDKKSPDSIFYKFLPVPGPRTRTELATTRDRELVPAAASQTGQRLASVRTQTAAANHSQGHSPARKMAALEPLTTQLVCEENCVFRR